MAKFFVGQRVRKVRGVCNIGREATVYAVGSWPKGSFSDGGFVLKDNFDVRIKHSAPWFNTSGDQWSADHPSYSKSEYWEPITDLHQPCESEFKESLDRLLERVEA